MLRLRDAHLLAVLGPCWGRAGSGQRGKFLPAWGAVSWFPTSFVPPLSVGPSLRLVLCHLCLREAEGVPPSGDRSWNRGEPARGSLEP